MLPQLDEFFLKVSQIKLEEWSHTTAPLLSHFDQDLHVLTQKMRLRNFPEQKIRLMLKFLKDYLTPESATFDQPRWMDLCVTRTRDLDVLWMILLFWKTAEAGFVLHDSFPRGLEWEKVYLKLQKKMNRILHSSPEENSFLYFKEFSFPSDSAWKKIPFWVLLSFSGLVLAVCFYSVQFFITQQAAQIVEWSRHSMLFH